MALKSSYLRLFFLLLLLIDQGSWSRQYSASVFSETNTFENEVSNLYHTIDESALNYDALRYALIGYHALVSDGIIMQDSIITIIDYNLPSSTERFFVIDLNHSSLLYKALVAHGRNTGLDSASSFSNKSQSYKSSLGFFLTGHTYPGSHGYSLTLKGLEPGFNDQAEKRAIVIHGADYVSQSFISQYGRLGRSLGCPALPVQVNNEIIEHIKGGSLLFAYFNDKDYIATSGILKTKLF